MELMLLHYLLLAVPVAIQIFLDGNGDGQQQPSEPSLVGHPYTLTWVDGDTSSVALGTTDANGYLQAAGQGTALDAEISRLQGKMRDLLGLAAHKE
jgi:hypothetical protein